MNSSQKFKLIIKSRGTDNRLALFFFSYFVMDALLWKYQVLLIWQAVYVGWEKNSVGIHCSFDQRDQLLPFNHH